MLINIIEQSLLFLPIVCAMYFSYKILKVTDVSIDGTFVLGAAVSSQLLLAKINILVVLMIAIMCGFIAGMCVAFIQRKNSINDIIAGLLMSYALYSINLVIMKQPSVMLLHTANLLKIFHGKKYLICILSTVVTLVLTIVVMQSKLGLKLRAFGENQILMTKLGFNTELYRTLGLSISGMLASFYGAITCQIYGYSDINMGFGIAITAIGSLIIGLHLISKIHILYNKLLHHSVFIEILSCFIGSICYFTIINSLIFLEIDPMIFKLVLACIIIAFLKIAKKSNMYN